MEKNVFPLWERHSDKITIHTCINIMVNFCVMIWNGYFVGMNICVYSTQRRVHKVIYLFIECTHSRFSFTGLWMDGLDYEMNWFGIGCSR